jgi:glycosyltransferase involved in cell wall biosynthesis
MTRVDTLSRQVPTSRTIGRLRIAMVAPVAQSIPPERSGSVESVTALLTEGLVARGHDVTLFATGTSRTGAKLHATFPRGYKEDPDLWPWELCELLNFTEAAERAEDFDVIHYQAEYAPISLAFTRLLPTPVVTTLHHAPTSTEIALWSGRSRSAGSFFIAVSEAQRKLLDGLDVAATIHHAVHVTELVPRGEPEDQLVFLGRFTDGKGVLDAIEVARRVGKRLVLAAAANEYFQNVVAPHVDGDRVVYAGELDLAGKSALLAGSRALLYPVRSPESFGLVLAESMVCGTPVAALRCGPTEEIVENGVTGGVFDDVDAMVDGLPRVLALDRQRVRERGVERFGPDRMVDAHLEAYASVIARAQAGRR